jgi:hypothetical protein
MKEKLNFDRVDSVNEHIPFLEDMNSILHEICIE